MSVKIFCQFVSLVNFDFDWQRYATLFIGYCLYRKINGFRLKSHNCCLKRCNQNTSTTNGWTIIEFSRVADVSLNSSPIVKFHHHDDDINFRGEAAKHLSSMSFVHLLNINQLFHFIFKNFIVIVMSTRDFIYHSKHLTFHFSCYVSEYYIIKKNVYDITPLPAIFFGVTFNILHSFKN